MGRVVNKDGAKLFLLLCTHYFCFIFFRNDLKTCFKEAVSEAKGYSSFSLPVCLKVFFLSYIPFKSYILIPFFHFFHLRSCFFDYHFLDMQEIFITLEYAGIL